MDFFLPISSLIGIWFLVVTIPGPNFVAVTQCSMAESRIDGFRGIHGCGYMGDGQPAGFGCRIYSFTRALRHHTIGGRFVSDVHRAQDHSGSFFFFAIFINGKSIARFKICCFPQGLINQFFQPSLAFVWDVLLFQRPTSLMNWVGVSIVLFAIYLGSVKPSQS